jgi:hypothetical protein
MDCFSSIFILSFQDFYTIVLDELALEVVTRHRDDILAQPPDQDYNRVLWYWMNTISVMLYLRGHQQLVMRCGFLLVEGCMVTCLVFNSKDYSCVICWLFNSYLILFKW